jgi:Cu2+-exporting ATPase
MDLPVSVGILAGTSAGVVNTVRGTGEIYFDSVTGLIFLLLVGRWLQRRRQRVAAGAADLVAALAPSTARVVTDDGTTETAAGDVAVGSLVEVRAGDRIPVDGDVLDGVSTIDASLLTGESMPGAVRAGDLVHAGTTNLTSRLLVRTARAGAATRIAELAAKMEAARLSRAPAVLLADRVARVFVVVVLGLAALTFAYWTLLGSPHALDTTIAVLVVSCPCALGLATPLTMSAALGQAARSGLLVKGGAAVEQLARPGLVVFDKTGTLTRGKLTIEETVGEASLLPLVAAAEQLSTHPVARALGTAAGACAPGLCVEDFREIPGRGIVATVDGLGLVVGTLEHVRSYGPVPAELEGAVSDMAARALTPVVAADRAGHAVVFGLGDPLRPEAPRALASLADLGYRLAVLSGDRPETVRATADRLGVTLDVVRGGVSPEDKLQLVTEFRERGPVFMVGDGVNDAAALGAATAGIAVHGGAEASLGAADVFATEGGLDPVVRAFRGAGRTLSVLQTNIAISLVYNVVAASLAMAGVIGPLLAAVLMPLSSLTVVTLAYRSRTFEGGAA